MTLGVWRYVAAHRKILRLQILLRVYSLHAKALKTIHTLQGKRHNLNQTPAVGPRSNDFRTPKSACEVSEFAAQYEAAAPFITQGFI